MSKLSFFFKLSIKTKKNMIVQYIDLTQLKTLFKLSKFVIIFIQYKHKYTT